MHAGASLCVSCTRLRKASLGIKLGDRGLLYECVSAWLVQISLLEWLVVRLRLRLVWIVVG